MHFFYAKRKKKKILKNLERILKKVVDTKK